jgi:hypothetical protein
MPSLYIYIEGGGAVTILFGSKEGVMNYIQKLLSIGIRLVWPILLGFGVVDATPLLSPVYGPGQGPRLVVTSLGNPVGPASTPGAHARCSSSLQETKHSVIFNLCHNIWNYVINQHFMMLV